MTLVLDTNRYTDFCRNEAGALSTLQQAEWILLPFVVLAELRSGFRSGTCGRQNEAILVCFLSSPRVRVIYADEQTTHLYAGLFTQLKSQSTPIPTNDLWIAALAVQHDAMLFSRDAHFDHLPQLLRG